MVPSHMALLVAVAGILYAPAALAVDRGVVGRTLLQTRCPAPPSPPANATWPSSCTNALSGTRCNATCSSGFSGSPFITCNSGTWSAVVGSCVRVCQGLPSLVANGSWPSNCNGAVNSSVCTAVCATGFSGTPRATCMSGNWSRPAGSCNRTVCGSPPAGPSNASWPQNCSGATNGTRCVAQCAAGFSGAPTRTCINGNWTAAVGTCNRTVCQGLPSLVANSSWPTNCSGAANSSVCTATCATGFSGTPRATCVSGNWSRPAGSCNRTVCGSPPAGPSNATWPTNCSGASNGTRCVAQCAAGFSGAPTRTCINGNWTAAVGTCNRTACTSLPAAVPNTSWPPQCAGAVNGSLCTGSCAAGFSGAPTSTCVNGNWSRAAGSCNKTITVCGSPPAGPSNASWPTNCTGATNGTRCVAQCAAGFSGAPTRTCINGNWTAAVGTCNRTACTSLPAAVANTSWPPQCAGAVNGSLCTGSCAAGFSGAPTSTCVNGNWSRATGSCNSTACPGLPAAVLNTTWPSVCAGAVNGSLCNGSCAAGFTGAPSSTCVNGNWSRAAGICSTGAGCPPGATGPGAGCSTPCPVNTYQPGGNSTCLPCTRGWVSPKGSSMCTDARMSVWERHACFVVPVTGGVVCRGNPNWKRDPTVATPPQGLTNVTAVSTYDYSTCVVAAGRVICWGSKGALPDSISSITDAVLVYVNYVASCVLTANRQLACWNVNTAIVPSIPSILTENVGQVSISWIHLCIAVPAEGAFGSGGRVTCLGDPDAVAGFPAGAIADRVDTFGYTSCITTQGRIQGCYGGYYDLTAAMPRLLALPNVTSVSGADGWIVVLSAGSVVVVPLDLPPSLNVPAGVVATSMATDQSEYICLRTPLNRLECYGVESYAQFPREPFIVGANYSVNTFSTACPAYGAQLASLAQLQEGYGVGAEWCDWGFLGNTNASTGAWLQGQAVQPTGTARCGVVSAGVNTREADTLGVLGATTCYGVKPATSLADPMAQPFNSQTWSMFDA